MVVFAIHWHESAMGVHASPILNPPSTPSPSHPSGSSQWTGPECLVSCVEPGLVICFTYGNIHVSMLFSQRSPRKEVISPGDLWILQITKVWRLFLECLLVGRGIKFATWFSAKNTEWNVYGRAWWATICGVTKSWTRLSDFT